MMMEKFRSIAHSLSVGIDNISLIFGREIVEKFIYFIFPLRSAPNL